MNAKEKLGNSRRTFIKAGGAALTVGAATLPAQEKLALSGGSKTVNFPASKLRQLTYWPRYGAAEKKVLHDVIDSGKHYEELELLEKEFKAYTNSAYVKSHMNGTSALTSLYFALDLPRGSEIMVPSYTFFATAAPMYLFGLVPIFVDLDPKTGCFDLEDAKRKLTPRTKALVPMHSWGMPCEMDKIADFAKEKGLILLEDAAQAAGASMQGKKMGTWGVGGIFSFQASKVLPGIEGGMGMYQSREYFERAAVYGHYEICRTLPKDSPYRVYHDTGFGQKLRMHPLAAALIRQQLRGLDERNAVVEKNVRRINDELTQLPGLSEPRCRPDQKRVYYYRNMLLLDSAKAGFSRDALLKALQAEGVQADHWFYPVQHRLKFYSEAKWWHHPPTIPQSMPGTDWINNNHIFLPLIHGEAPELHEQYVKAFKKIWAHRSELARI